MNTLFVTKREIADIKIVVEFLSMQVRDPDKDDWNNLSSMMRYLLGTPKTPITIHADRTNIFKWWVDVSN